MMAIGVVFFFYGCVLTIPEWHLAYAHDACYNYLYPTSVEAPNLLIDREAKQSYTLFPFGVTCTWTSADGTTITKYFGHWQTTVLLYSGAVLSVFGYTMLLNTVRRQYSVKIESSAD